MAVVVGAIHQNGREFISPYWIVVEGGFDDEAACEVSYSIGQRFELYEDAVEICERINRSSIRLWSLEHEEEKGKATSEDRDFLDTRLLSMRGNPQDQFYFVLLLEAARLINSSFISFEGASTDRESWIGRYCNVRVIILPAKGPFFEVVVLISLRRGSGLRLSPGQSVYGYLQSSDGLIIRGRRIDPTGAIIFPSTPAGDYTFTLKVE